MYAHKSVFRIAAGAGACDRGMGHAGSYHVHRNFTMDRMVDATLAVYAAVAGTIRGAGTGHPQTSG